MRIPLISMLAAGAIALGGCAYGGLNFGYGDPYSNYGYGNSYGSQYGYSGYNGGYGYNSGYGYGGGYGYGSPYGYGSGYGYGSPYSGWYDNYYYPGSGYYVYDSYRRPIRWSDTQQRYWTDRRQRAQRSGVKVVNTPNWGGFTRPQTLNPDRSPRARAVAQQQRIQERISEGRARADERRSERATARTSEDNQTTTKRRRRN
ncbi:MAG: hypothetical protein ABIS38_07545 [Sphingomicrobium sp.]